MGTAAPFVGGNALNVATAYRCIKLLADSVASLPLHKRRKVNGVFKDVDDHLDYLLSVQPNAWTSAFEMWSGAVQQLLLYGNAYLIPLDWKRSAPGSIILATPGAVAHDTVNDTYTVNDATQGITGLTLDERDIIHIKNFTLNGKTGIGVIAHAMLTIGIAAAGDNETLNKFQNGGTVKGILSVKDAGLNGSQNFFNNEKSTFDAAKLLNEQKRKMDIVAMPGEYNFQQYQMTSAEQQFLENRKFTVLEVCRFFGVHPSFVYADTASNYKSAEMANVAFLVNTLNPLLRKIENELRRKLTGENLSKHITFEFDRTGMYAADLTSRVNYLTKLIGLGRTVNEIRLMENLEPIDGGDTPLVSANLRPLDQLTNTNNDTTNGNDKTQSLPA